jgi:hypothetical protein
MSRTSTTPLALAVGAVAFAIFVLAAVILVTSQRPTQVQLVVPTPCTQVLGGSAGVPAIEVPCTAP